MSKITKNYIYNLMYQFFVLMVPIITAPYLARTLGPGSQGISSYVVSISNIISTITLLGIFNYGNRQIAYERGNKDKMSQTFWEVMLLRLLLAIPGSIIYIGISFLLKDYTSYFLIYYIWMLGTYIDCTWIYVGVEDMRPAVIKNFIAKLITVLGIFIIIRNNNDINKYLFLLGTSVFIANLLGYIQLNKYVKRTTIKLKNLVIHLKGSVKLFLPTVATLIYMQVDKVMIEFFSGQVDQVAFYDNSEKIVTIPLTFITVLSTVMMPRIANEFINGNNDKVKTYLIKAGQISLYLAFPMTLGIISIASKFVPWYLGVDYKPVIYGIIIIAPIIICNSLEGISGRQYFTATNQIKILGNAYGITAIMNILINILLIPKYGFIGAAIATLLSSLTCISIQFSYLNKQISMKSLVPKAIKYFCFASIMYISVYLLSRNMNESPVTTIAQIIIGLVVYFTISAITRDNIFIEICSKGIKMLSKRLNK